MAELGRLGRYNLLRPIARGGMAELILAERRGPGGVAKQLAVKRILGEHSQDPRFAELFLREAQVSMALTHKNIVPVFDFGKAGDEFFLVMEYVDGLDLRSALRASREQGLAISPLLVAHLGLEACQGLHYAHTRSSNSEQASGVVHRDITPGNILLSRSGEVKLVDFGVAASLDDGDGGVRGTPGYMSPEQAAGQVVDARSDVFSLGLVLWEALAGRRAYPGNDRKELLAASRVGVVQALAAECPVELRKIIEKATAKDPEARWPSSREMQAALDRFVLSARSDSQQSPQLQLEDWVRGLTREDPRGLTRPLPQGEVVTYLDGGEQLVASVLGEASDETLRSMAATVVSQADAAAENDRPEHSRRGDRPSDKAARGPRIAVPILVLGAVALAGGGIYLATSSKEPPLATRSATPPSADAAIIVADAAPPPVDADVPADASVATLDAATARGRATQKQSGDESRPKDKKFDSAPPRSTTEEKGTLRISTSPWAQVSIQGRGQVCAETPCQLQLKPGTYTLELQNPVAQVGTTTQVTVRAKETTMVQKSLTRQDRP